VEHLKKLFAGGNSPALGGDSETSGVLATLAALAEAASSSSSNQLNSEAQQWLESYGLTTGSTHGEDTMFQSALDCGQSVGLTDAGKLALNYVKTEKQELSQGNNSTNSGGVATSGSNKPGKVMTIVADSTQLPQIISSTQSAPIVLVTGSNQILSQDSVSTESHNSPGLKRNVKTIKITKPLAMPTISRAHPIPATARPQTVTVVKSESSQDMAQEREKYQKEIERLKKQVEDFKAQLRDKDREAQEYKRQLEALTAATLTSAASTANGSSAP
jgi:hypothetical protein